MRRCSPAGRVFSGPAGSMAHGGNGEWEGERREPPAGPQAGGGQANGAATQHRIFFQKKTPVGPGSAAWLAAPTGVGCLVAPGSLPRLPGL